MKSKKNRIGEEKMMNCGMKAKITEYVNNQNITVLFENGDEKNTRYDSFVKGKVAYNGYNELHLETQRKAMIAKRVGKSVMQSCGLEATIIQYNNYDNILIRFSNGVEKPCSYGNFIRGQVAWEQPLSPKVHIGEENTAHNGQKMKITDVKDLHNMDVLFEDGTIVHNVCYQAFKNGHVKNPNYHSKIGEKKIIGGVMEAEIVRGTGNYNKVVVRFSNGFEKEVWYSAFKTGEISLPPDVGNEEVAMSDNADFEEEYDYEQ